MPRPLYIAVTPAAIRHNLDLLRSRHPGKKILAVIKANAYGHGVEVLLPALAAADGLALLELDMAKKLRHGGWDKPLVMLEGAFGTADTAEAQALRLDLVVHHDRQIEWLAALPATPALRVFLKLNSGMNRLGFETTLYHRAHAALRALPQVGEIVHTTHFANADDDLRFLSLAAQQQRFVDVIAGLAGSISCANSAACFNPRLLPQTDQWLRPGLALYGVSPFASSNGKALGLEPAQALFAGIIALRWIKPGEVVGYGSEFRAQAEHLVATIACGYGDGYHRASRCGVLIHGHICPVLGRVSMDMMAVDVTPLAGRVAIDDAALLWGEVDGLGYLPVETVAASAATIGYELLCGVSPRITRLSNISRAFL